MFTIESDSKYRSRIEAILGKKIDEAMLLNTKSTIEDHNYQSLIEAPLTLLGKDINIDKKLVYKQHAVKVYDIKPLTRSEGEKVQ